MERFFGQVPYEYKVYSWKYSAETEMINVYNEKNEILFALSCREHELTEKANSKYMKLLIESLIGGPR